MSWPPGWPPGARSSWPTPSGWPGRYRCGWTPSAPATVEDSELEQAVERVFDLRPAAIIRDLDLRRPIYRQLAAYGHFGRDDLDLPWERTDRTEQLRAAL